MVESISSRLNLQSRSFYIEALKQHRRAVALIITTIITVPLFLFTSLPPIEVLEEVSQEIEETIEVPISVNRTIEVEVNKTIQVEVNITKEVVLNRTIGVNITEGGSIFLEPQPAPPLVDSDIVLCIDTSGSMVGNRMPMAQEAIARFLDLINQSNDQGLSQDRVALVSFAGNSPWDGDWSNDATIHTGLDFISNQTHLDNILNETYDLVGVGWTDAWAGLNFSLDLLLNNQRNTSTLKSIIFLTDGEHNTGPWGIDVSNENYNGFLSEPAEFISDQEGGPYSESPVKVARENNVKIFSIGLFEGTAFEFDEHFLRNISLNETYGTFGDFFVGNDSLSLSEGFLQARDTSSGWINVLLNESSLLNEGTSTIFSYNVTSDVRRLKWDLNWANESIIFNLTLIDPNGTIFEISENTSEGIIPVSIQNPMSIILDFPIYGVWNFNVTWSNLTSSETIKNRLSSFEPPIFIESITKANNTFYNQSAVFFVNVTNKNPTFTFHDITPFLLGNLSSYNISSEWDPSTIITLETGNSTIFMFNLTFNEPAFLQGTIYFKVNCTEGYYDAVAQDVMLDYRVTTENITIETYTENQTITVLENQTLVVIENQTISTIIITQQLTKVTKYTYDRQVFDTLKWGGFFVSLGILMSFLAVYVTAQAYHLRGLAKKFRARIFPDYSFLEAALKEKGISVAPDTLSAMIDNTTNLDQFGENIFSLTGKKLTPEDLILLTSGVSTDQIINRLSFVTRLSPDEISKMLNEAKSVENLIETLNLDIERFLDIITHDEQVISFQSKVASMIKPKQLLDSHIILFEDLDISKFRSRLKRELR